MKFTKKLNGIILAVTFFILIFLVSSCKKEYYRIYLKNNYFEDLYSIKLNNQKIDKLQVNETSKELFFYKGKLIITSTSISGITFSTIITLAGNNKSLLFEYDNTGNINKIK